MAVTRRAFVQSAALSAGAAMVPLRAGAAASDLADWRAVRSLFDLAPGLVHASLFFLASHPRPVREAIERLRAKIDANPYETVEEGQFGPAEHNLEVAACVAVARYLGASPGDVALANSTTQGLANVYHALPLQAGDEVLTTAHDHVVHHESIRTATERCGATWRKVALFPPHDASGAAAGAIVATLREAIRPATRVIGITWVQSSTGLRMPLAAVAAMVRTVNERRAPERRLLLVVDGVHGLGAVEPEAVASGIDVFVAGLHKWMLAPRGTGVVWARPEVWAVMRPVIPSFSSDELYAAWEEERPPRPPARASWFGLGGFQAFEHVWAIPAAVELHEGLGPARVAERIRALNGTARAELARIPHVRLRTPLAPELSAGITAFEVDGLQTREVVSRLRARSVIASASPYRISYPRLAFGLANSEDDVAGAVVAVRELRAG